VIAVALAGTRSGRNLVALGCAVAGVAVLADVRLAAEPAAFAFAFANCAGFVLYIVLGHKIASSGPQQTRPPAAQPPGARPAGTQPPRAQASYAQSPGARAPGVRAPVGEGHGGQPPPDADAGRGRDSGAVTAIDQLGACMVVAAVAATPFGVLPAAAAFTHPVWLLWGAGVALCSSVIPYVSDQLAMARLPRATFAFLLALLPASAAVIGLLVLRQVPTWRDVLGITAVIAGVALHRETAPPGKAHAPAHGAGRRP